MNRNHHTWTIALTVTGLIIAGGSLAWWWWRAAGYVSTEDARVKAEIVSVSPEITGRIERIFKEEGAWVQRGEVLARLDQREVEIQIRQAQAEIDRLRSRSRQVGQEIRLHLDKQEGEVSRAAAALRADRFHLEDARAHLERAEEDWQRAKALFERELIAAQERDRAETELRQARARLSALREKVKEGESSLELVQMKEKEAAVMQSDLQARQADVRRAEAVLAELRRKLELTAIYSPVEGVIVKKSARQGEVVQAGQPIFMVVDASRFWVEANVEETAIRYVEPGSPAIIRVDSYPDQHFAGKVIEVGGATVSEFSLFTPQKLTGQFIKSTQRLPVKISVENRNGLLKVGMLAVVWIKKSSD